MLCPLRQCHAKWAAAPAPTKAALGGPYQQQTTVVPKQSLNAALAACSTAPGREAAGARLLAHFGQVVVSKQSSKAVLHRVPCGSQVGMSCLRVSKSCCLREGVAGTLDIARSRYPWPKQPPSPASISAGPAALASPKRASSEGTSCCPGQQAAPLPQNLPGHPRPTLFYLAGPSSVCSCPANCCLQPWIQRAHHLTEMRGGGRGEIICRHQ